MDGDFITRVIKGDEGWNPRAYECSSGRITIGWGFNVDEDGGDDIPAEVAELWLQIKLAEREEDLISIFGPYKWVLMLPARRAALISMHYWLGAGGFRRFKKTLRCVIEGEWTGASREFLDSKLYLSGNRGTRTRCKKISRALATGEDQWS